MGFGQILENFAQSALLAIASIILVIATVVNVVCSLLPWWFILKFDFEDGTFGTETAMQQSIDIGIFFIYKPNKPGLNSRIPAIMTSLLAMDNASNLFVVPRMFKAGQVMFAMGFFGIFACTAGALILGGRRLGSLTGSMALSGFTLAFGVCNVLGIILLLLCSLGLDGTNEWNLMPLDEPYHHFVINAHPSLVLNWAFYIACIGAILSIVGAVLIWMQTLQLCRSVEEIRQKQMKTRPAEEPYPDDVLSFSYTMIRKPPGPAGPPGHGGYVLSKPPQQTQTFLTAPQMEYRPPEQAPGYRVPPSPQSSVASEASAGYKLRQVEI